MAHSDLPQEDRYHGLGDAWRIADLRTRREHDRAIEFLAQALWEATQTEPWDDQSRFEKDEWRDGRDE